MTSSRLIRWSGLALLVAGLLIAIPMLLHPSDADPQAVLNSAWVPIHSLLLAGALIALFGLIGLYGSQADAVGTLGLIGFILTFVGIALVVAVIVLEAFVVPAIAASAGGQALLDPAGPLFGGTLGLVFLLMGVSQALGFIILGFATARAAVLPRWAGVLLLVGGPLLAFSPPLPQLVGTIGGVLMGASFVWLGYAIWSSARVRVVQARAAV